MPSVPNKDLPALYRSLLQGHRKLAIWGATHNVTIHEWQRQIQADLFVDTQWGWWNDREVHGHPIQSPSEIAKLPVSDTVVINNYYYASFAKKVEDYLGRIGGYANIKPAPLHEMARTIAAADGKKLHASSGKNLVDRVNRTLADLLTAPENLQKQRPLPNLPELTGFFGSYKTSTYFEEAMPHIREESAASLRPRPGHVCLLIGALHPGGAERQLCNLAVGLQRIGWKATVLVYNDGDAETAHYRQFLADEGVDYHMIRTPSCGDHCQDALNILEDVPSDMLMALWHLRAEIMLQTILNYKALRKLRPELLISYLDWQNTFASLGGLLAGVPRILMSGRNAAPTHFPHFYNAFTDFFRDNYRFAISQPGVSLSNNSNWGAASYARWLKVPPAQVKPVLNCVTEEFSQPVAPILVKIKRMQLSLRPDQQLILGVFRLSPEKRPLDFIRTVASLYKRHPKIRAIICGQGPLEHEARTLIEKLKMNDIITLQGVVSDIPLVMHAATLLLHTAEAEGSPNVILEAQTIGLPVVCTDSGGIVPCLAKSWLPYMKKVGDIKGLTQACDKLLKQPKLRKKYAAQSRKEIKQRFSISALTKNTLIASGMKSDEIKRPLNQPKKRQKPVEFRQRLL